jgi:hypothetical protein
MKTPSSLILAPALFFCLAASCIASTSWVQTYSNAGYTLYGVAFGGGELVAGGVPPTEVFISPSSTNWSGVNTGISANNGNSINTVSFGHGLFLAGCTGEMAVSPDGTHWNAGNLTNAPLSSDYIYQSVYAPGLYVTAVESGTIATSPNGTNWTMQTNNLAGETGYWLFSIAYGNGLFVSVGGDGNPGSGTVVTSTNGTNWSLVSNDLSANGTSWFLQTAVPFESQLNWVTFGNGRFVAVGNAGMILLSTDGTNWVQDGSGVTTQALYGVTYYQNGQFVIVGDKGTILVNQPPAIRAASKTGAGCLDFSLVGLNGAKAVLQASPTLGPANWQPIVTNIITNGTTTFTNCPGSQTEFYRALVQ